ncbi:MAG: hypothetical protein ACLP8A_02730 [Methylovirgula sp.]
MSVDAADLDRRSGPPPGPPAVAVAPRPCRMVPMPEMTISGQDVARYRPTWVCVSRGLYADSLGPPPPRPERPWFFWW